MCFKLTLLAALAPPTVSQAIVQAYWNMDSATLNGKIPANSGTQAGNVSSAFEAIDAGFIGEIDADISGTTVNILPPPPGTNRSVGFFRAGSIYYDGAFLMNDFDFTSLSDVDISFAYRALNVFTWDTNLEVDYRIDDGSWTDVLEGVVYSTDWTTANVGFGSALDGQSNVDFRIRTEAWASVGGYLDIDNVQVNAVPEPQTYALLAGSTILAIAIWRRRR